MVLVSPASWAGGALEIVAAALLLGALAALVLALLASRRQPGGLASLFSARGPIVPNADQAAEELRALIAEARDMSDQLAASFDARAAELDRRIADLEERAALLQSMPEFQRPSPVASGGYAELKPTPSPSGGETLDFQRGRNPQPPQESDPMTGEIYRLSDQGLPAVEIARHLGQHTGKVELILALRRA